MTQMKEQKLIDFFSSKTSFSRTDLFGYFLQTDQKLNENTFGWRIFDLKKKNILHEVKKGWYTISTKPAYLPFPDEQLVQLAADLNTDFRHVRYCVWRINWLNEFTVHQFSDETILFDIERDVQESAANRLHDRGHPVLWALKGTLLSVQPELVIVSPLISRAPIQKVTTATSTVIVPTLEKILVDIYQDEKIFYFVQGAEMTRIFERALSKYTINYTTLFSYAKRRGKETELREFLSERFPEHIK